MRISQIGEAFLDTSTLNVSQSYSNTASFLLSPDRPGGSPMSPKPINHLITAVILALLETRRLHRRGAPQGE
jgi:hypothetical protein